jgi:hypothetical protein
MNTFSQILLLAIGVIFVPFGIWALAQPTAVAGMTEVELPSPAALADGRAVYGGLTLGLGVFFLLAARSTQLTRAGLWVALLSLGGAATGRLLGVVLDGASGRSVIPPLAFELLWSVLAATALTRQRQQGNARRPTDKGSAWFAG